MDDYVELDIRQGAVIVIKAQPFAEDLIGEAAVVTRYNRGAWEVTVATGPQAGRLQYLVPDEGGYEVLSQSWSAR